MKKSMRRPVKRVFVVLWLLGLSGIAGAAELVIIANPDLPGPSLDVKGLQRIYMGKLTRWSNDEAIVPAMLKTGPVHDAFVESYLERSMHRFVTYWRQMVFTGKGMPPRSFASEKELIAFVAITPGSVGYASAEADTQDVKVLSVSRN